MATFPTPPLDTIGEGFKCVIVFIPEDDNALFFANFLGQYTELVRPFAWDGTYQEKGIISQKWQDAYSRTLRWIESGDCQEIIGEDGNMTINVNVNTECGGGTSSGGDCIQTVTILPYNPGGSMCLPIETFPVNPPTIPPLLPDDSGDGVTIPDPVYPSDPPYQGTQGEYNAERCELAELAYEYLHSWVTEWKKLDNLALTIGSILLALNASGVTAVIALLLRVSASELIQLVASFIQIAELVNAWDAWVDDILTELESRKEELICGLYTNLDTHAFMSSWSVDIVQAILATWQDRPDWQDGLLGAATKYLELLFPASPIAALARLNVVAASFNPTFDCSICDFEFPQIDGYKWIDAAFGLPHQTGSHWQNFTITTNGNIFQCEYNNVAGGGADDKMDYDVATALSNAGFDVNHDVAGVLWKTIQSVSQNDAWRLQNLYGPPDWSPKQPPDGNGAWGWVRHSSFGDQPILDFGQWVIDNEGKSMVNNDISHIPDTFSPNANFNPPDGTTLILQCWFLIPLP